MMTENHDKKLSVGEIAAHTGVTVRTLQHYDNIGLLPASGRTDGGRRYYTKKDLVRLEQIVFYKSIGVSLKEMKQQLEDTPTLDTLENILNEHLILISKQVNALHLTMSVVESTLSVVKEGNFPPWKMLANLIRSFSDGSLTDWKNFAFDEDLIENFKTQGFTNSLTSATELYHSLRQMMVESASMSQTNEAPDSPAAQELAKNWWNMMTELTSNGDKELTDAFLRVNQGRSTWPEQDRKLFEVGEQFLETALSEYISANHINVPEAFQGE